MENVALTKASSPGTDWKEVGITALVTFGTALVGGMIAVLIVQKLIIPAIDKASEKRKEKDAAKK